MNANEACWRAVAREAERQLEAAIKRTEINAAARRLMLAPAERVRLTTPSPSGEGP